MIILEKGLPTPLEILMRKSFAYIIADCPSSTKSGFRQYLIRSVLAWCFDALTEGQTFHLAGDEKGEPANYYDL